MAGFHNLLTEWWPTWTENLEARTGDMLSCLFWQELYWRRWIVRATKGAKVTATASMSVVTSPGDGLWPYLLYNTVSVSYIFQLSHSIVSSLVAEDDVTKRWIVTSGGMIAASHPSLLYKVPIEPELDWLDPGLLTRMFARQSSSWSSALP